MFVSDADTMDEGRGDEQNRVNRCQPPSRRRALSRPQRNSLYGSPLSMERLALSEHSIKSLTHSTLDEHFGDNVRPIKTIYNITPIIFAAVCVVLSFIRTPAFILSYYLFRINFKYVLNRCRYYSQHKLINNLYNLRISCDSLWLSSANGHLAKLHLQCTSIILQQTFNCSSSIQLIRAIYYLRIMTSYYVTMLYYTLVMYINFSFISLT
jgi:hypothetical protein